MPVIRDLSSPPNIKKIPHKAAPPTKPAPPMPATPKKPRRGRGPSRGSPMPEVRNLSKKEAPVQKDQRALA